MCHNVGILYMREAAVHYIGVYITVWISYGLSSMWVLGLLLCYTRMWVQSMLQKT